LATSREKMKTRLSELAARVERFGVTTWTQAETLIKRGKLEVNYPARKTIDEYYAFRKLEPPNGIQSFWFYLSEVGELAEAMLALYPEHFTPSEKTLLSDFVRLGLQADSIVSSQAAWTRNNERTLKPASIESEAADNFMMLDRTLKGLEKPEAFELLLAKMESKGFKP